MIENMKINQVYNVDCLVGMRKIEDESIDLIYLDPPFFTQKNHSLSSKNGEKYTFSDKWENIEEYLNFLKERFLEMKRILKKDGNIFVHCDKTVNHKIRNLLEKVFGEENFRSEIIWTYKRWSNSKKGLLEGHQNIYYFSKTKNFKFNTIYNEYSPTTNLDQILQMREKNSEGKSRYKKDENGNIVFGKEKKGVPLNDVWDIPFLNPKAKERVGYPTQKPILLLERIIEIASNEDDIVLDPFVGSGTTVVASKLLNRNFIGFDISEEAINLCKKRLEKPVRTNSNLLQKGIEFYEKKTDREKQILKRFDCDIVQRNKGLDGILKNKINEKIVGIKIQKESETLCESEKFLKNAMKSREIEYSILVRTHDDLIEHKVSENIMLIDDIDYLILKKNL